MSAGSIHATVSVGCPNLLDLPHLIRRQELEPFFGQLALERSKAAEVRKQDWEWMRYLSCTHVPHPKDRIALSDFLTAMSERNDAVLSEALSACQDCYHMIRECVFFHQEAHLSDDASSVQVRRSPSAAIAPFQPSSLKSLLPILSVKTDALQGHRGPAQARRARGRPSLGAPAALCRRARQRTRRDPDRPQTGVCETYVDKAQERTRHA